MTPLSTATAADAPSSAFNIPGQARTRTCVAINGTRVPLRFADGTPTGWFVSSDDPSQQGGNHAVCLPGTMEMDVHEVLTTAGGMKLYFHPGASEVQVVTSIWRAAESEAERLAAADAILKLGPRVTMDETTVRAAKDLRAKVSVTPAASE